MEGCKRLHPFFDFSLSIIFLVGLVIIRGMRTKKLGKVKMRKIIF